MLNSNSLHYEKHVGKKTERNSSSLVITICLNVRQRVQYDPA